MSQESRARRSIQADISRIIDYAPAELIGREHETKLLNDAWEKAARSETKCTHVLTLVALGGEGKTSLVAKWAAELAHQNWPGCDAAFAWSFYSQGTSEKTQASSDSFLREALLFFGDKELANSAAGSFDKGRRLAQLVGQRRTLLILDGLEPLQYAPTSPTGSELKDQGVSALLKALSTNNNGLCVVTTRYSVPDLRNFWQTTAPEIKLTSLTKDAGAALLRKLGVKGTQKEFEQLVSDVRGHALTLNLLGSFLRDAHGGDIRKRDLVKLEEADAEEQGGHAFHVMDAYVESFKDEGEKGRRALSILRLLGLFDRPATADCLNALWTGDEIGGLTGPLLGIGEANRNTTLKRLEDAQLVTVNRDAARALVSLDAHPLLREYFAKRVREELLGAWRAAHRRLYEHLRDSTKEGDKPTLEDLQPLYQAVAHGCHAGLQQEAFDEVLYSRLDRADAYSWKKLGAIGTHAGVVACFFDIPWSRVSNALSESRQGFLLNDAGLYLRALGRLTEALEPMRAATNWAASKESWKQAAVGAANLSELELTLGNMTAAIADAEQSVTYADRSGDRFQQLQKRAKLGNVLHHAGRRQDAGKCFREAEQMQAEGQPPHPRLYSLQGSLYCDFLLSETEHAAWQNVLDLKARRPQLEPDPGATLGVRDRAEQMLKIAERNHWLLDIALDHLLLGYAELYAAILMNDRVSPISRNNKQRRDIASIAAASFDAAVTGLRRAGQQDYLPRGLLSRAWLRFCDEDPEAGCADLDEAWEIAERGPMRLYMADIHLYRARLFHNVKPYPWNKFVDGREGRGPKDDLADARRLIEKCGYWRRKEELEDAEEAAKSW